MSTDRDTTRIVRSWLMTDEHESADRVLDAVLEALDTTPQRRATRWPVRRLPGMNNTAKLALGVAAVVIVALLGIRFLVPGSLSVGSGAEPTPTAEPAPTPSRLLLGMSQLEPGPYVLAGGFPVDVTFELAAGWSSCSLGILEQGICYDITDEAAGIAVSFLIVENVVADPCDGASLLDPPIGASVDDLVTAITNLPGFEATAAEDVTVDGFPATRLTVTAPADAGCELSTWATPQRTNGVGPGEVNEVYVIDVDGVRVLMSTAWFPSQVTEELFAVKDAVIASIRIEP